MIRRRGWRGWRSSSRGGGSSGPQLRRTGAVMDLVIDARGVVRCVYGEAIDLTTLGPPTITRASHVEPDGHGRWWADLAPAGGPRLGPFNQRSQALGAERAWLEGHWPPTDGIACEPADPE